MSASLLFSIIEVNIDNITFTLRYTQLSVLMVAES
jgi:hypothetical protein